MARVSGMVTSFISEDVDSRLAAGLFGISALLATLASWLLKIETADRNLAENVEEVVELSQREVGKKDALEEINSPQLSVA